MYTFHLLPFSLCVPASTRTWEDRRLELHGTRRGHYIRKYLETRHMSGRNNCHRHHPEIPHSDFPRVKSGQRLLQRLGPESLNSGNGVGRLAVEAWWEGAGGTDTVGKRCHSRCFHSLCLSHCQPLPTFWVVHLHAQSHLNISWSPGKVLFSLFLTLFLQSDWVALNKKSITSMFILRTGFKTWVNPERKLFCCGSSRMRGL